jgi:hypothetical protein
VLCGCYVLHPARAAVCCWDPWTFCPPSGTQRKTAGPVVQLRRYNG